MNPLKIISSIQMVKYFSHFGLRTLLLLYMVEELGHSDTYSYGLIALFCALCELAGIFGGIIADKFLGLQRSTAFGGIILCGGYLCMPFTLPITIPLSLIITGSALFSSNLIALLGLSYRHEPEKRHRGFTIYYMVMNIGALLATIICAFVADRYGYKIGFAIASIGMLIGNIFLFLSRKRLATIQKNPSGKMLPAILSISVIFFLSYTAISTPLLAAKIFPLLVMGVLALSARKVKKRIQIATKELNTFLVYLGALLLFVALEDQISSSILLFSERTQTDTFFGFKFPSELIMALNPITLLVFGTFMGKKEGKIALPFLMTGGAFSVLALIAYLQIDVTVLGIMQIVVLISLCELMICPMVFNKASKIGGEKYAGLTTGMVVAAASLAYSLSGALSQTIALETSTFSHQIYARGFGFMALMLLLGGALFHTLLKPKTHPKKTPF